MAGLYADVPGPKMYYERDGSALVDWGGTPISAGNITTLNDESMSNVVGMTGNGTQYVAVIFPQLRDLAGVWWQISDAAFVGSWLTQTSVNTTNGIDGTWVTQTAVSPATGTTFRTSITALAVAGIKGVRVGINTTTSTNGGRYFGLLHLYGTIPAAQSVDRLRLWHPTNDAELTGAYFDYSDTSRTYTYDKTFRVKNNSATFTANSIVLSNDALTDTSPTVVSQLSLSQGAGFASTQNIGNLAAGAISAVCTQRLTLLSNTTLGIWRQRLIATAGSWT